MFDGLIDAAVVVLIEVVFDVLIDVAADASIEVVFNDPIKVAVDVSIDVVLDVLIDVSPRSSWHEFLATLMAVEFVLQQPTHGRGMDRLCQTTKPHTSLRGVRTTCLRMSGPQV